MARFVPGDDGEVWGVVARARIKRTFIGVI
jgi:hypothetical protein